MRFAFLAVALVVLCPLELLAFNGQEHRDISNFALLAALASERGSVEIRDCAQDMLTGSETEGTFGELVSAVDAFSHPEVRLTGEDAWKAVGKRKSQPVFHLLALHRNAAHFQREALSGYTKNHAKAIKAALDGDSKTALRSEAVALHFLQDSLAGGHLLTPRRGMSNAVAGAIHDRMNGLGAVVDIAPPDPDVWIRWLDVLKQNKFVLPPSRVVLVHVPPPSVTVSDDEIERMRTDLRAGATARFRGDDLLNTPDAQIGKMTILLLCIQSIADVLDASRGENRSAVQACFSPRSMELEGSLPKKGSFQGPSAVIDLRDVSNPLWDEKGEACEIRECDGLPLGLVRYSAEQTPGFDTEDYAYHGVQATALMGVSRESGDQRTMIEIGSLFNAGDPPGTVRVRGANPEQWWPGYLDLDTSSLAVKGSIVKGPHYYGVGLNAEWMLTLNVLPRGISVGPRWGYCHYSGAGRTSNVFEYGAKAAVGIEVLNLTLVVDRGIGVDKGGSFHNETFVMGGLEASLSWGWVRHVFGQAH